MTEDIQAQQEEKNKFEGNYLQNFSQKDDIEALFPGKLISWKQNGHVITFYAENTVLEFSIISETILKFRYANDGYFLDDFSYAIDPKFKQKNIDFKISETEDFVCIQTDKLKCYIDKSSFTVKITDHDDNLIIEDEKGYHWKEEKKFGGIPKF